MRTISMYIYGMHVARMHDPRNLPVYHAATRARDRTSICMGCTITYLCTTWARDRLYVWDRNLEVHLATHGRERRGVKSRAVISSNKHEGALFVFNCYIRIFRFVFCYGLSEACRILRKVIQVTSKCFGRARVRAVCYFCILQSSSRGAGVTTSGTRVPSSTKYSRSPRKLHAIASPQV